MTTKYYEDPRGVKYPESLVKEVDKARDEVVRKLINLAKEQQEQLARFKRDSYAAVEEFVIESAEKHGVKLRGDKGGAVLTSFDGKLQVRRSFANVIRLTEEVKAAKQLLDGLIKTWTKASTPEIQVLIQDAFRTDQNGDISYDRIARLKRLDIKHRTWVKAMKILDDAVRIEATKTYINFYERGADGSWHQIPLSLATITPAATEFAEEDEPDQKSDS